MLKAGKVPSVLLTRAHGLSEVSGCPTHHVCHIYFALYCFASTLALWTVGTDKSSRARKRDSCPPLLVTHLLFTARELVVLGVESGWPGHIFYLFNYVS